MGATETESTQERGSLSMDNPFLRLMTQSVAMMEETQKATFEATRRTMDLFSYAGARLWGFSPDEVIESDRRFKADAWKENLAFDLIRQSYLTGAAWLNDLANAWETVDPELHMQARFWTAQMTDALSPTNFPWSNPEVIEETIRTGGRNLVRGTQNLISDIQEGRIQQVKEGAFQVGENLAVTPGKVVYRNKLIELIQYEPATEEVQEIPILVIPPWINKYYVMDMEPGNSMFKFLVESGFTVFTISWKNPEADVLDLDWEDYMDLGPLEAMQVVQSITGSDRLNLVGYCLGGLVEEVTLAYLAAKGEDSVVNTATYFTTHQDFKDIGDIAVFMNEPWIQVLEWMMEMGGGYLDGRRMAATFNSLRANDFLWRFYVHNYLMGKEPEAFGLLYWNSDGTRIPAKVHKTLVRDFFMKERLLEPDGLEMKGVGIDIGRITTPSYVVTASWDHIVPWRGGYKIRHTLGGPVRFILTEGGHIAGIINPPGKKKRAFWTNEDDTTDPDAWLEGATRHPGSWWPDWRDWLRDQSGESDEPPSMGNEEFPPIEEAPGTYVLET